MKLRTILGSLTLYISVCMSFEIIACPHGPQKSWQPVSVQNGPPGFEGIADPKAFWLDEKVWVFWTKEQFLDTGLVYSPCTNTWGTTGLPKEWLKDHWDPFHVVKIMNESLVFFGRAWKINGNNQETWTLQAVLS